MPAVFASAWLGVYLKRWPGIILALGLGCVVLWYFGPPLLDTGYGYAQLNTGVVATFASVIGALTGGQGDKVRSKPGKSGILWNILLAVVGLVVGYGLGFVLLMFTSP